MLFNPAQRAAEGQSLGFELSLGDEMRHEGGDGTGLFAIYQEAA